MSEVNASAPVEAVDSSVEGAEGDIEASEEAEGLEAGAESQEGDVKAQSAAQKKEAKRLKKLKLKVFGKEIEEELPFEIDDDPKYVDYMTKQLQLAKASQKSMSEKAAIEKEVGEFLEELRKNPRKVLNDPRIGVDIKQLAAQIIEEEIENSKKTPEELEREKLENELKALREEREREKEEHKTKEFERLQEQEIERYDMLMTKALEKSDLPKSPYVVKKMADYMLMGLNNGMDVTPEDVLPLVREEVQNDIKELAASLPEETLEALFGDVFKRIRKKNVSKVKAGAIKPKISDTGAKDQAKTDKPVVKQSMRDFFGF